MDYRGLYEDLLAMEHRAMMERKIEFASLCRDFRRDLLARFYSPLGRYLL